MGTLSGNVISTSYKKLVFTNATSGNEGNLFYTLDADGTTDTALTTLTSPMTFSGLITASAGIKLGNNIIYASDGDAAITLDTSNNVTIGGDLTITGGNITNAITTDALLTAALGVKLSNNIIYNSEGTAALTLDTDEDLTITGDLKVSGGIIESTTDGDLEVRSDGNISFYLDDDNDETGQKFYFYNDTTEIATLDESGHLQINGDLTISGGNITNALTLDSTLDVGGNTTITGNLTFTGARDILFTESDGLEIKDENSLYVSMISNTMAITPPTTFAGKVLLNGNTGPTPGTGITDATDEVHKSWVERYGTVIKTSILIDITGLRHSAAADIIGNDGTSNPCHIGQITTALNGTIFSGRMTCLETPTTSFTNIDLYAATEGTGVEDTAIATLTEKHVVDAGTQVLGDVHIFDNSNLPAGNDYLYLVNQDAGTAADYDKGKFLIELWGTV